MTGWPHGFGACGEAQAHDIMVGIVWWGKAAHLMSGTRKKKRKRPSSHNPQ
jgi:hypothetical protein